MNTLRDAKKALAKHLGVTEKSITPVYGWDWVFESDEAPGQFLVLTDDNADVRVREEILDNVWAFRAEFLESHSVADAETIRIIQEAKYEDANEPLKRLITDLDHFMDDAIAADGRGHFLARYDGEEHEVDGFFIYRLD